MRRIWGAELSNIDVDGLIRLAYEAAAGERPWSSFAAGLADASGYAFVMIRHAGGDRPGTWLSAAHNVAPAWCERFATRFRDDNPYCNAIKRLDPQAGTIQRLDEPDLLAEVERSAFYAGFMQPQAMVPQGALHMSIGNDGVTCSGVMLFRRAGVDGHAADGSDASPERAIALGQALMPHLQTAACVQRRMRELERAHGGLTAALDRLPHGIALLDASGKLMMLNRCARDALEARDGLYADDGAFGCSEPDARRLAGAIGRATAASRDEGPSIGAVLHVRRPSKRRAYELLLCPLDGEDLLEPGMHPAAVVFISDPDDGSPLSTAEALRETYGLTRRESQVALGVLRGQTILEIAGALELGRETIKTHLAGVYGKTGCRGQAELVRRLLLGVGALQAPSTDDEPPAAIPSHASMGAR